VNEDDGVDVHFITRMIRANFHKVLEQGCGRLKVVWLTDSGYGKSRDTLTIVSFYDNQQPSN